MTPTIYFSIVYIRSNAQVQVTGKRGNESVLLKVSLRYPEDAVLAGIEHAKGLIREYFNGR